MALHYMLLRCEEGHLRAVRRPNNERLVPRIVAHSTCYICDPETLALICGACLVPFAVVPHHSRGLCGTCARREFYRNLSPERQAAVRAEEMIRRREFYRNLDAEQRAAFREKHARYMRSQRASH